METTTPPDKANPGNPTPGNHHLRYHLRHLHLAPVFGTDWFALKAEGFARFFGTPVFLIGQTIVVAIWMVFNILVFTKAIHFDEYPFILLNLAFSLQAAYAAPLILLAQTRQADRDKAHSEADAQHREDLANASEERQKLAASNTAKLTDLMEQNTRLTEVTHELSKRIEALTAEIHTRLVSKES